MFRYILFKIGQTIVNVLPLKASYFFAQILSDIQYFCSPRDRQAVRNNLRILLKRSDQLSQPTREVFRNFGKYLVEFFRIERFMTDDFVKNNVRYENINILDEVMQQKKGGIIVTAHLGNWEFGGVLLAKLGYSMSVVALSHKQKAVNDLFIQQRTAKSGIQVIPTEVAYRRCLKALKNNELIALVADRDFGTSSLEVDFFGHTSLVPKGAALFALKTGAPLIPVFLTRDGFNKFVLTVKSPIYSEANLKKADESQAVLDLMGQYLSVFEQEILKNPSQWTIFREFYIK